MQTIPALSGICPRSRLPHRDSRNDSVSYNDSGTDLAAGMGLNLKTDSPISVRVDLTYYDVDTTSLVWIAQLMGIYSF